MAEHRGEIDFAIPSFSAFNRYALRLSALARRLEQAREMGSMLAARFDAQGTDDLTRIASQAVMALVLDLVSSAGESGWKPIEAMQLASAMKAAAQAQGISTERRQKVEKEFAAQVDDRAAPSRSRRRGRRRAHPRHLQSHAGDELVSSDLTIYGRANCPQCHATRRKAEALGLAYRYVDLDQDPEAEHRLQIDGHRSLPVVEAGDLVWAGFRPGKLEGFSA